MPYFLVEIFFLFQQSYFQQPRTCLLVVPFLITICFFFYRYNVPTSILKYRLEILNIIFHSLKYSCFLWVFFSHVSFSFMLQAFLRCLGCLFISKHKARGKLTVNAFDIRVFPASHFILVIPRVQNNVASFGSFLDFLLFHTNSRLQLPLLIYQLLFLILLLSDSRKLNAIPFPLVSPPCFLWFLEIITLFSF